MCKLIHTHLPIQCALFNNPEIVTFAKSAFQNGYEKHPINFTSTFLHSLRWSTFTPLRTHYKTPELSVLMLVHHYKPFACPRKRAWSTKASEFEKDVEEDAGEDFNKENKPPQDDPPFDADPTERTALGESVAFLTCVKMDNGYSGIMMNLVVCVGRLPYDVTRTLLVWAILSLIFLFALNRRVSYFC